MLFKDWRLLDTTSVHLSFDLRYVYYVHSRAWALKGWLGGTHSWLVFWSKEKSKWLTMELTTKETLDFQETRNIYYIRDVSPTLHSPVISDRCPDGKWFGSTPTIVGQCFNEFSLKDFEKVCKKYPFDDFNLFSKNCNTFTSYVNYSLGLNLTRPIRSFGARDDKYWHRVTANV